MPARRIATLAIAFLALAMMPAATGKTLQGTVAYVVDGDTAVLDDGTTVHYSGVEAPAFDAKAGGEGFGRQCFDLNKKLVAGKQVRLELDAKERDEKGALLAYVYVGKYFVNASLIQSGYARASVRSPNTRFAGLFERLQAEAREQKRGLWKLPRGSAPAFSNDDLAKAAADEAPPNALTNKDLEKYDVPDEAEAPPEAPAAGGDAAPGAGHAGTAEAPKPEGGTAPAPPAVAGAPAPPPAAPPKKE